MSKNVKLVMSRYGGKVEFMYGSLKAAARNACADVETNEAAPLRIEVDGVTVWENTGPFDGSYDRMRELADERRSAGRNEYEYLAGRT